MTCAVPGCRVNCLHTHAVGNNTVTLFAVTHWDSPEGQTRPCPNCDVLAVENAKLREAAAAAVGAWMLTVPTPTLEGAMRDLRKLVEGREP